MFKAILCSAVVLYSTYVYTQVVDNIRLRNHRDYMVEIIRETVLEVEKREWCNLKLSDITQDLQEDILNWQLSGSVLYTNGFVVSIQHVDIVEASLGQIWTVNEDDTVRLNTTGQLRMTDLSLGYDVIVTLPDGDHFYTGVLTHPEVEFNFFVLRNVHTHSVDVVVVGRQPLTMNTMTFLPSDNISDTLTSTFESNSTYNGVTAWATEVFQPIALDVVTNKVEFPGFCYDNCDRR